MNDPQPPAAVAVAVAPPGKLKIVEWFAIVLPSVGAAITFGTYIWHDGQTRAQIDDNTRRITVLESSDRARLETLNQIDARTARIEGKLELLIQERPK